MNFANERKAIKDAMEESDMWDAFKKSNAMLAGGALTSIYRGKPIADFDLYFRNGNDAYEFIESLEKKRFSCLSKTDRSALFSRTGVDEKFNVIYFEYFKDLAEVFKLFDFTCCMCGYDAKNDVFDSHPEFYRDSLLGNIVYSTNSRYPLAALLRVQKYIKKGFKISKKEMIKIILDCYNHPIESMDDLEDQLGSLYGSNIKELVGDIDPFDINVVIQKLCEIEDTNFEKKPETVNVDWKEEFAHIFYIADAGEHHFLCRGTKIIDKIKHEDSSKYLENTPCKLEFPLYVYKHVKDPNHGGGNKPLCSFYKNQFKYPVGMDVETYSSYGMFCYLPEALATGQYRGNRNSVAIEIRVDRPVDLVAYSTAGLRRGEINIKKGFVTRIVKEEEYDGPDSKIDNGYLCKQQQVLRYGRIGRSDTSQVRKGWFNTNK